MLLTRPCNAICGVHNTAITQQCWVKGGGERKGNIDIKGKEMGNPGGNQGNGRGFIQTEGNLLTPH
jgi:hypothetical protein